MLIHKLKSVGQIYSIDYLKKLSSLSPELATINKIIFPAYPLKNKTAS
jgi:hypothetical protein